MRRLTPLAGLLALVLACDDSPTETLAPSGASELTQDATLNGGNQAFFWLAPILKDPVYAGSFNPALKPSVVICELDTSLTPVDCKEGVAPIRRWRVGAGLNISLTDEHYGFEWHTDETDTGVAIDYDQPYRIQVFLTEAESTRLGFADVQFFSNGQELKNIETGDVVALRDGRTLPGRFRIEEGVSCDAQTDCGEAVVGVSGGVVTTESGFAGVAVPQDAVDGDILITIRRVDPGTQAWRDCLPTGLRQEEGCYEFDTQPAIGDVNAQDSFNTPVTVGVCLDPGAPRPENLTLHKYDPENPAGGVVELTGAPVGFLTCDGFAFAEPDGFFGRFASAARRLLRPVASIVGGRPLYATDTGRGGLADSFSFIGWAEPVSISAPEGAPDFALPGAVLSPAIQVKTAHNHPEGSAVPAPGVTLSLVYTDPLGATTVLPTAATDASGQASWTLTSELGTHTLAVSTAQEIAVAGGHVVVPDPTELFTLKVGAYASAGACDGQTDCGQAVVGPDGEVVTTDAGYAGVSVPQNAVDHPVLITIRRVDPGAQAWGDCLPTGLRQEEGCYDFDTEPSLGTVNQQDAFNTPVTVAVCLHPAATRPDKLTLHKYDPEKPQDGVVELPGAQESFLTCDGFAYAEPDGLFGRFAATANRLLSPVGRAVLGRPLYATDTGRGGFADSFSFIGWAEPVDLATSVAPPEFALPGASVSAVIKAATAHNHPNESVVDASGATLRLTYTDPLGNATLLAPVTTDASGEAAASWTLTQAVGTHVLSVSTETAIPNGTGSLLITDPTELLALEVGAYTSAGDCGGEVDCGQAVVGPEGDIVTTDPGHAGVSIPQGALDGPVLVTVRRIDPATQPWGDCLPTGLRQEEGCYEFDTEPAIGDVNNQDAFNSPVTVAVCIDPNAIRPDRLALHKYDPENPAAGVLELPAAAEAFLTCDNFAYVEPDGLFGRLAAGANRLLAPVARAVVGRPLYATDTGRGGLADSFSFIGWAEPVTLTMATEPDATTVGITDVVVTASTAHNHGELPLASDGTTLRFEHTDPSGNVTASEVVTAGNPATARISLTAQGGTHNVRVSTQEEILIDSSLLISGAAGFGIFGAPTISMATELFLVPDPTAIVRSGDLTVHGLVSRWDADDGAAPFADRVGPNQGGVAGAVSPTAAGVEGNGFFFDGSGGVMSAPAAGIGEAGRFTVAAWVKLDPAGPPLDMQTFVSVSGSNGEKAVLRQESSPTDLARQAHFYGSFGPDDGTGSSLVHIRQPNELVAGCWQHLAGTYDGTQLALYRNGGLVATQPVPLEDRDASVLAEHVALSSDVASGDFPAALWGTVDEVEVHNRTLSASEIQELASRFTPACDITTGAIGGKILDGATGAPMQGVSVVVDGTQAGVVTNTDGDYLLRDIPTGVKTVRATFIGYEEATRSVTVTAGGFASANFTLNPTAVSGQTVTGIVQYAGTGLDGVQVELVQGAATDPAVHSGTTDASGVVVFPSVADGSYHLKAYAPSAEFIGWKATTISVAGTDITRTLDLPKKIQLESPASGATLTSQKPTLYWVQNRDASSYTVQVNETDTWNLVSRPTGITSGSYQMDVPLNGGTRYSWQVDAYDASSRHVGTTQSAFTFTVLAEDQVSDAVTGTTYGPGSDGGSMYQSFTPGASNVAAIKLLLRAGGSFPQEGLTSTINVRNGSPGGEIMFTGSAFVPGPVAVGSRVELTFEFPDHPWVSAGKPYVLEWQAPGDAILTWFGADGDPYPAGTALRADGTPMTGLDFLFRTYSP